MSHDEYAVEPIRGLPERPPAGERILWQGAPRWQALAIRAFHVRKLVGYFILLWAAFAVYEASAGHYGAMATTAWRLAIPAVLGVLVLTGLAALYARMTVYTITSERVVIRSGIALPMNINVPFARVESAAAKHHRDGSSDIPLRMARGENSSYVVLWPNVRPWQFRRPEPMLRGVTDGEQAARVLAEALAEHADDEADATPRVAVPSTESPARDDTQQQRAIA